MQRKRFPRSPMRPPAACVFFENALFEKIFVKKFGIIQKAYCNSYKKGIIYTPEQKFFMKDVLLLWKTVLFMLIIPQQLRYQNKFLTQ